MDEINKIEITAEYRPLLALLHQRKYSDAFLLGCIQCTPSDKLLNQLLAWLLRYKGTFQLNINAVNRASPDFLLESPNNFFSPTSGEFFLSPTNASYGTPIYYAAKNKNSTLYFLLSKSGALVTPELNDQWEQTLRVVVKKIQQYLNKDLRTERNSLISLMKSLPLKHQASSDALCAEHDKQRLLCLLKIIKYITTHYRNIDDSSAVTCELNAFEKEILFGYRITEIREYIKHISTIVANLSGTLRGQYAEFLKPHSWIIIEQLGGVIKQQSKTKFCVHFGIRESDESKVWQNLIALNNFIWERSSHDDIVEYTLPDVIRELPILNDFFRNIYFNQLKAATPTEPVVIKPIALPVIHTVTRYFNEIQCLIKLLELLSYQGGFAFKLNYDVINENEDIPLTQSKDYLSTKLRRHALLRKLQRIGELFTGKNSDFTEFDESIDFRALIELRDIITHQDLGNNKFLIDALLNDEPRLKEIIDVELADLLCKVEKFIILRHTLYGGYDQPQTYWANVLKIEQERAASTQQMPPAVLVTDSQRKVSVETEERFMRAFEKATNYECVTKQMQKSIEEAKSEFREILDGTRPLPDSKLRGALLQPFAVLKKGSIEEGELYKTLQDILKAASGKSLSITTLEEREAKRAQAQEEARQRTIEKENKLTGLKNIRQCVAQAKVPINLSNAMSPIKRVNAALEAVENAKEFLMDAGYLDNFQSYKSIGEWDDYNQRAGKQDLVTLLLSAPFLKDALEYNAGQLLQHLDQIRRFQEAQFSNDLQKQYEELRRLRNYIEHDDPLIESYDEEFNRDTIYAGKRQKIIAPKIIYLIFEMSSELHQIKRALEEIVPDLLPPVAETKKAPSSMEMRPEHVSGDFNLPPLVTQGMFRAPVTRTGSSGMLEQETLRLSRQISS